MINFIYSRTSDNDHNPFRKVGRYPKCSLSETIFPIRNKGNRNNWFLVPVDSLIYENYRLYRYVF